MRRSKRNKTVNLPKKDRVVKVISVPQGIPVEMPIPKKEVVPIPQQQSLERPISK